MKTLLFAIVMLLCPVLAFAQDSDLKFLTDVYGYIGQFGGLPWMAKVASGVLLVIASMKVSFLQPIWSKLGSAQAFAAPVLGLLAGVFSMGGSFTWAGLLAYVGAGAGAVLLHELLDAVKGIPGIGGVYVSVINFIETILGAPAKT